MPTAGPNAREATLNLMAKRHEPFREIINRFGLLLCRQVELRAEIPPVDTNGVTCSEERFLGGEPLANFLDPALFMPGFRVSALRIWPVMGVIFPALTEGLSKLGTKAETDSDWTLTCLRAVAHGDGQALDQAAAQAGVSPEFLFSALSAAYAPCIAALKPALLPLAPVGLWRHPHCPVCGSDPDMASLENHPDPSEFLVSKSGEVWHHCPVCSHRWRFVRISCPGCGNQKHEQLTRFSLQGNSGEYIYACDECRQYLPCVDLVEKPGNVDFDLTALGLIHLDAAAQCKGYTPLSPAPWTTLGFVEEQIKAS